MSSVVRGQSGLTMVEILISLGLFAALFLATTEVYSFIMKSTLKNEVDARLDQEIQYLTDFLVAKIEGIGGSAVRPWASIWVEDGCAARNGMPDCNGSDRLTIAEADTSLPECDVLDFPAANQIHVASPSGTCCLTAAYQNKQVVVSRGDFYIQQYLTNVQVGPCTADIATGQGGGGINRPPGALSQWANSKLSIVKMSTYFLDTATFELKVFSDLNNNGSFDGGEISVLADGLIDLQFALGYDSNPRDGRITDSGDQNDEWLFNFTDPQEALGVAGLASAEPRDLRMVAIGMVLGRRAAGIPQVPISVLNGPQRVMADMKMRRALSKVRVRNLNLFLAGG